MSLERPSAFRRSCSSRLLSVQHTRDAGSAFGHSAFGAPQSTFGGRPGGFGGAGNAFSSSSGPSAFGGTGGGGGAFGRAPNNAGAGSSAAASAGQVALTVKGLQDDLGPMNRPMWKMSSFGPAKLEPNLIIGMDMSPEEMRLKAYEARKTGQEAAYVSARPSLLGNGPWFWMGSKSTTSPLSQGDDGEERDNGRHRSSSSFTRRAGLTHIR